MKLKLLVLFVMFVSVGFSQQLTSVIKGSVIDKTSQATLIGVNIVLVGSEPLIGTISDINGEFRLENVPTGRHTVRVSYLGYETREIPNLLVLSAKDLNVSIALSEKFNQLGEFVVRGEADKRENINKMNTVSSRTLSIDEATRFSGSLQDPARMSQNYAGVSGSSDDRNDVIIRGNSPTGVLWRLEGVDIPSPNHFSTIGTTGGPISMLNVNNLKNSEFMTSAWSAEYGNALSGVFDLQLREGNNDSYEHLFQVGVNGFELGSEGPFKKRGRASYMFNYRYSTLGIFQQIGVDLGTGSSIPEYQDITFKVNLPTKKMGTFSVFGIGGISFIDYELDTSNTNLFADENQEAQFRSQTGVLGVTHKYFFNSTLFSKLSIVATGTRSAGDLDSTGFERTKVSKVAVFDRVLSNYVVHFKLNKKINVRNNWNAGVIWRINTLDFVDSNKRQNEFIETLRFQGEASLGQAYFTWRHHFNEKLTANIGVQGQYFNLSKSTSLEPRLGLRYELNNKNKFTYGFGMHSQTQPISVYFVKDLENSGSSTPNKSLDFSRSIHNVIGYERNIGLNTRLKLETYFQYIYNVPVDTASNSFSMLNEGADFTLPNKTGLVNEGTGMNYGIEITFEKFLSKGYYFLVTTSIFDSKFKGSDGVERNTAFNNQYVFNALAGKEFELKKNVTLTFDGRMTYAGGKPFTPIDLDASNAQLSEVRDWNIAFSDRYQGYFRLDFKVGMRWNQKNISHEFMLDIQNITNQKNIFIQGYQASSGQIKTNYQRGFFPVALYKLYF
ncbi:MAG: TonB-dependent receptor [Flavobacteriales bacterium]